MNPFLYAKILPIPSRWISELSLTTLIALSVTINSVSLANAPLLDSGGSTSTIIGNLLSTEPEKYYFKNGFNASGDISVIGPVVIVSDGDFNLGNNEVTIATTGSLTLYVKGDIKVSGNGAFNNNGKAQQLQVWGTATDYVNQNLAVSGNGFLSAVIYAPHADFVSNGGGTGGATVGSIIAKTIRFNGNPGSFHFDEDLLNLETNLSHFEYTSFIIADSPKDHLHSDANNPTYKDFFESKF